MLSYTANTQFLAIHSYSTGTWTGSLWTRTPTRVLLWGLGFALGLGLGLGCKGLGLEPWGLGLGLGLGGLDYITGLYRIEKGVTICYYERGTCLCTVQQNHLLNMFGDVTVLGDRIIQDAWFCDECWQHQWSSVEYVCQRHGNSTWLLCRNVRRHYLYIPHISVNRKTNILCVIWKFSRGSLFWATCKSRMDLPLRIH